MQNKTFNDELIELGYTLYQKLGEGTYGSVTRAESPEKQPVAIKKCKFDEDDGFDSLIENEILNNFCHSNVLKSVSPPIFYLKNGIRPEIGHILELGSSTLENFFTSKHSMDTYISMFSGLFDGLRCLHKSGFLHLDIKPQNIIIMQDGTAKLCDFGLSIGMLPKTHIENGVGLSCPRVTIVYRPLENVRFKKDYEHTLNEPDRPINYYGGCTDVFSLGLCFFNALMGENHYCKFYNQDIFEEENWGPKFYSTFYKKEADETIAFSVDRFLPEAIKLSPKYTRVVSFLKDCLHIDPYKRLQSTNYKNHTLFSIQSPKQTPTPTQDCQSFSKFTQECNTPTEPALFTFFLRLMKKKASCKSSRIFFLCWDLFDRSRVVFHHIDMQYTTLFGCVCFNLALKLYDVAPMYPHELIKKLKAFGRNIPEFPLNGKTTEKFIQAEKVVLEIVNGKFIRPRFDDYCLSHIDLCTYAKVICNLDRKHNLFYAKTKKEFIKEINQLRGPDAIIREESKKSISEYVVYSLII